MMFETLAQGHVTRRRSTDAAPIAAGPRCVPTAVGDLVCTYMVQSKLGINDFVPTLSRSGDGGLTWREQGPLWPHLAGRWSIFANVSRAASAALYMFGSRCRIDVKGESFWSDATQGLKENELIWAVSTDHGVTWSDPEPIPMPIPGAAEAPGPLAVTRGGVWVAPYSPYRTFDPAVKVDRGQVVAVRSADCGKTWTHTSMLRFDEPHSGGAEAWCVELGDGRLLGAAWHVDHTPGDAKKDHPNKFALSHDSGRSWSPTRSTGITAHTTALAALPGSDRRALFLYVKRKPAGDVGVWLAVVEPDESDFGVIHNQRVWSVGKATRSDAAADHDNWTDFNFGEPCVTPLADGTLLVCLWYIGAQDSGVRWVKLRASH